MRTSRQFQKLKSRWRRSNPLALLVSMLLLLGILFYFLTPSRKPKGSTRFQRPKGPPPQVRHIKMSNLTATADPIKNREPVLILTPLARFYEEYWANLEALTYPHELIELAFIVPRGKEGNTALSSLENAIRKTQLGLKSKRFAKISILRQDFDTPGGQTEKERHAMSAQKDRRAAMSRARNSLLFTTLGAETAWVLWLDSDIVETPITLIQDLASHNKDVIVPNCFQRYREAGVDKIRPYDFNSWHESSVALDLAKTMGKDDIILEGYAEMATYRALMAYERNENGNIHDETMLDGVGGTALFVKADVHRDGAMFPPFAFYHLIETEGFAKMAKRLGYQPYGLPNYLVYHKNE